MNATYNGGTESVGGGGGRCRYCALSRGKTQIGQFHRPQIVWLDLGSGQLHRSRIALSFTFVE